MKTELDDELWAIAKFSDGFKCHYCPRWLIGGLVADITGRGGEFISAEPVTSGFIDLPGMVMADRPIESIRIDTFTLEIPSQDFDHFFDRLSKSPVRRFSDGSRYYKLHSWMMCVVLSTEQGALLVREMRLMAADVRKRADSADTEFARRMKNVPRVR